MHHFDRIDTIIERALDEDIGGMDCTSESIFPENHFSEAVLIAKADGILAGLDVFLRVFRKLNPQVGAELFAKDGEMVHNGDTLLKLFGPTRTLLMGERTALNLIQRMSGIATMTHDFVTQISGTNAKIVDTRKTAPGLRVLDKKAVRLGGGFNHRMGLYDAAMIKDNHIDAAGGIEKAVALVKVNTSHMTKIEVEVRRWEEVETAIASGADVVMLDNMSLEEMKKAVEIAAGRVLLEASGNMTLERVKEVAQTGVDLISVGALTHSVKALDLSLKINMK